MLYYFKKGKDIPERHTEDLCSVGEGCVPGPACQSGSQTVLERGRLLTPRGLPGPGTDPASPARPGGSFTTEPPGTKVMCTWRKWGPPWRALSGKPSDRFQQALLPVRPLNTEQKRLESVDRKHIIFHQETQDRVFPRWAGKNCHSLVGSSDSPAVLTRHGTLGIPLMLVLTKFSL